MRKTYGFAVVLSVVCVGFAHADVVRFASGGSLEGVVLEENETSIVFKQGPGKMTLQRSMIAEVIYDSADANEKRESGWKAKHAYSEEYAPEEFKELAAQVREFQQVREAAMMEKRRGEISLSMGRSSLAKIERSNREIARLEKELLELDPLVDERIAKRDAALHDANLLVGKINKSSGDDREALEKKHQMLERRWQRLSSIATKSIKEYRALRKQLNDLSGEIHQSQKTIESSQTIQAGVQGKMLPYIQAIEDLNDLFKESATPAARKKYPEFFDGIDVVLARSNDDLCRETAAIRKDGNLMIVDAVFNGSEPVQLILDTGASKTTLSKALATRMGIVPKDRPKTFAILADGSMVESIPTTLASIQVGTAVRHQVSAMILDTSPGPGVDGLLGMSFLKHFMVHLDVENNRVELIHLGD